MYREAAARDPKEAAPADLLYVAVNREGNSKPFVVVTLPAVLGIVLATFGTPSLAPVGIAVSLGLGLWLWRRRPTQGVVLRVEGDQLRVLSRSGKVEKARFRLDDLVDVALDTKTVRPVQEGASAIPAMRFIATRVGPDVDKSRIVLVGRDGPSVPLSDEYVAHMDATEWLGKIRVFLRRQRWVPEDERDDDVKSEA